MEEGMSPKKPKREPMPPYPYKRVLTIRELRAGGFERITRTEAMVRWNMGADSLDIMARRAMDEGLIQTWLIRPGKRPGKTLELWIRTSVR
jgi:hypothetical protein